MAKYRFELRETIYHTYEVELPDDIDEFQAEEYFYDLSLEDQKKGLVSSESFEWEIIESERM